MYIHGNMYVRVPVKMYVDTSLNVETWLKTYVFGY